jgi:hypothetical protein
MVIVPFLLTLVVDLSKATVVIIYLSIKGNLQLRSKLIRELPEKAQLYSINFHMGNWKPSETRDYQISSVPFQIHRFEVTEDAKKTFGQMTTSEIEEEFDTWKTKNVWKVAN